MRLTQIGLALVPAITAYAQTAPVSPVSKRPATIDDLLSRVAEPEQIAVSPDSAWVAVAVERPATAGEWYRDASGLARSDIWLFSLDSRVRRNLTLGKADASGWWEPVWSPDGQRLAMLSTRGHDGNARLYVWDRARNRLTLATERVVSRQLAVQVPVSQEESYCPWLHVSFAHYAWSSNTALIFLAFPQGTVADWHWLTETPGTAERAWARAERGTGSTASVLDAGPGVPPVSFAPLELTQVQVISHTSRMLEAVPMGDYRNVESFALYPAAGTISPDGHTLALLSFTPISNWPDSSRTVPYLPGFRLSLIALNAARPTRSLAIDSTGFFGTDRQLDHIGFNEINCGPPRARWASDAGSVLVNVPRPVASEDRWYRVTVKGAEPPALVDVPPSTVADTARLRPLVLAVSKSHGLSDRYDLVLHGRDTVLTLNSNGTRIDGGRKIAIPYRGVDGDSLTALLELPVGYTAGQRYPMITVVYHSAIRHPDDTVPTMEDALWAAHGYLVLYPSMPTVGEVSDILLDLPKGVFPAIDRVIALGYANPDRLGVMGSSFGGFSTFGLIAYSDRFKAAIAENGPTDWVSYDGTFAAPYRYRDILGWSPSSTVPAQAQLGGPPWVDLERYIRNSPLTYVDRIHTPVMIVHGDLDAAVPMQQSEEMFTALYRLGRRVQFVRYWGEGHWNVSPANIRDRWEREIKWFDTYLKLR